MARKHAMAAQQSIGHWLWDAYHRHRLLVLAVATVGFLLQAFHLYWLFTDVVLWRLTGRSFFVFPSAGLFVYVLADYLETPSIVSASLLYASDLRRRFAGRSVLMLGLVNVQWVHLLWLTDEVVVEALGRQSLVPWPALVVWAAIGIDYLEVPVIIDTLRRVYAQRHALLAALAELRS